MFLSKTKSEWKKVQGQRSLFFTPSPSPLAVLPATLAPYLFSDSSTRTRHNLSALKVNSTDFLQKQTSTDKTHGTS